jgi:hypothetical protein
MKTRNLTVTLPKIAAATAAALAITAAVLANPALAQAKTSQLAALTGTQFIQKDMLSATSSRRTKLFGTTAQTASAATIKLEWLTSPITAGAYATLAVRTPRPTTCSISVYYKSGPSQAAGLYPKRGTRISWTWKVGTRTTPRSWSIVVSCGTTGSLRAFLTVT